MFNIDVRGELSAAMYELLKKQPITDISIHQIVSECGLSRRTFYNHFTDKYDVMAFVYYVNSERLWYRNGKPCSFSDAYTRHVNYEQMSPDVFSNMYQYVGQNDIREFSIKKIGHDLRRMYYYCHKEDLLADRKLKEHITMVTYGLSAMYEHRIHDAKGYVPQADVVVNSFPREYREPLLYNPENDAPQAENASFDPASCPWPPKLY